MVGRLGLFFYYFYETQQKFAYYEKIALKSANIFVIRNSNKFKIFGKQEICIPKFLKKFEARFFLMTFAHFSLRTHDFLWKNFSTIFLEGHFCLKHEIAWEKNQHENAWSTKSLEAWKRLRALKHKTAWRENLQSPCKLLAKNLQPEILAKNNGPKAAHGPHKMPYK